MENTVCLLPVVEVFSLQKVVEMLEEVVVWLARDEVNMQMRQNIVAQFVQLLKHWLCNMLLGVVMEN